MFHSKLHMMIPERAYMFIYASNPLSSNMQHHREILMPRDQFQPDKEAQLHCLTQLEILNIFHTIFLIYPIRIYLLLQERQLLNLRSLFLLVNQNK